MDIGARPTEPQDLHNQLAQGLKVAAAELTDPAVVSLLVAGKQAGHRQTFKSRHQQDRQALFLEWLHLLRGNADVEVDGAGEECLMHELLESGADRAVAVQMSFASGWRAAGVDEGVHHYLEAFLALHNAAPAHQAERLIRVAGLHHWQRDATGNHLRVGGVQPLAQQLDQEMGEVDGAAAMGFGVRASATHQSSGSSESMVKIDGKNRSGCTWLRNWRGWRVVCVTPAAHIGTI